MNKSEILYPDSKSVMCISSGGDSLPSDLSSPLRWVYTLSILNKSGFFNENFANPAVDDFWTEAALDLVLLREK